MATPTLPPPPPLTPEEEASEAFIDQQLLYTRRQVKLHDLGVTFAVWLIATFVALLAFTLWDHWIWSLGLVGRWFAWCVLAAGSAIYIRNQIFPLVWQRINPQYAAKVIEHAQPGLKNSLLNFLFLKRSQDKTPPVVVEALRRRAAFDLSHVSLENVIDYSPLIRLGYVLCGLMVILAVYKVLSPKDPFRSVARVLVPWSEISQPSRVRIVEVMPGHVEKIQGERLEVTVEATGLSSTESVTLYYTTADEQQVDKALAMQPQANHRFTATLPETNEGLKQDLTYRVTAGDATSPIYQVRVLPSPRIVVERVELQPPAYTRKAVETLSKQGDWKALEGTQVTIHAQANFPIGSAVMELDPLDTSAKDTGASGARRRSESLPMQVQDDRASVSFVYQRLPSGKPSFTSYRLLFVAKGGQKNEQPIVHSVEMLPDLAPEIEVLAPTARRTDLQLDRSLELELRARDPDYGLSRLSLTMDRNGASLPEVKLLEHAQGWQGPVNKKFVLHPNKLGCRVGDELSFQGVAADNRHDGQGKLSPNTQSTERYIVRIVEPIQSPNATGNADPNAKSPSKTDTSKSEPNKADNNNAQSKGSKESSPENKQSSPDKQNKSNKGQENGDQESSKQNGGDQNKSPNKSESKENSKSGDDSKSQNSGSPMGGSGEQSDSQQKSSDTSEGNNGGAESSSSPMNGEAGKQPAGNGSGKSGSESGSNTAEQGDTGNENSSGKSSQQPGQSPPGKSGTGQKPDGRPLHDGEVIEKTLERLQEQQGGKQPQSATSGQANQDSASGESQSGSEPNKANPSETQNSKSGSQIISQNSTNEPSAKQNASNQSGQEKQAGQPSGKQDATNSEPGKTADPSAKPKDMQSSGNPTNEQNSKQPQGSQDKQSTSAQGNPGNKPTQEQKQTPKNEPGTGDPQGENRNGKESPDNKPSENKSGEASSPSQSNKQSPTKGGQAGDRSGNGNKGAGQSSPQPGNDRAGSQKAADYGAGAAPEAGAGETGTQAGQDQKSPQATGQSGKEPGAGSDSKSDPQGKKPQPNPSGNQPGGKGDAANAAAQQTPGKSNGDPVRGGGNPSEGFTEGTGAAKKPEETEAENLEYAKKATEMALQHLKDQQANPDPELLKRLGWTKDDLNAFLKRWEELKRHAQEDQTTRPELDDAYRNLGLRPQREERRSATGRDDAQRDLRDSGARLEPPTNYLKQFEAFRKGVSQGRDK